MAGGCSKTVHKQTAQLIQHIALFSRHPSNEQKIGITKFKSLCITTAYVKGFRRPRQTIVYPTFILLKYCTKVKMFLKLKKWLIYDMSRWGRLALFVPPTRHSFAVAHRHTIVCLSFALALSLREFKSPAIL